MLVITNEQAGRAHLECVGSAVGELMLGADVEVATCRQETDLDDILDRRDGRPLVLAGGDGTLHGVLRALWRRGETATCPIGLRPARSSHACASAPSWLARWSPGPGSVVGGCGSRWTGNRS